MRERIGWLKNSRKSLKIIQDELGRANILGVPVQISEADTMKTNENISDVSPEIYKALSSRSYTGKTMKNEDDISPMYNIVRDLGYTDVGDKKQNRERFFTKTFPK